MTTLWNNIKSKYTTSEAIVISDDDDELESLEMANDLKGGKVTG